ncbi:AAA family ATPase [Corallococcus sp. CA053C]|uniref:ATP-binding protein n=1 Tax=Corallococcus sp. CA053C TaxID=2316732 RepID=UPI000EA19531|nr:ATP-binding protein [Corallococcus sp. CA053C]RKH13590.1 AAA family ATPase [Corallococcus sp. CA053C]
MNAPETSPRLDEMPSAPGPARAHLEAELARLRAIVRRATAEDSGAAERGPLDLTALQDAIRQQVDAADSAGLRLPLAQLARTFHLSRLDLDLLLLALAPLLDPSFGETYARLLGDPRRTYPTVDSARTLLAPVLGDAGDLIEAFHPEAPLLRWELLAMEGVRDTVSSDLYLRPFFIDLEILHFIMASDHPGPFAEGLALVAPEVPEDYRLGSAAVRALGTLCGRLKEGVPQGFRFAVEVHGPAVGEALPWLAAATGTLGLQLFSLEAGRLLEGTTPPERRARRITRTLALERGALVLRGADRCFAEDASAGARRVFAEVLGELPFVYLLLEKPLSAGRRRTLPEALRSLEVELGLPGPEERAQALTQTLGALAVPVDPDLDPAALADAFNLTGMQLRDAVLAAHERARTRPRGGGRISRQDLVAGAFAQTEHRLGQLARRIEPGSTWEDLVLPESSVRQLRLLCVHRQQRRHVLEQWGFGEKVLYGGGTHALFSGPPGTGKTMAARIIAGALGLPLFAVDLASVVSKYIGETEKSLGQVFDEAARSNAILFFDEADALFAKRTEVKGSHDRYANLETGYLLQRMEQHEGITLLASNMRDNLDAAFARRLSFIIDFPFPDVGRRRQLLDKFVPRAAPVDGRVDWHYLAEKLELSGGSLRNVVLDAAFQAVDRGTSIDMRALLSAARREYGKLGRAFLTGDFQEYAELLTESAER